MSYELTFAYHYTVNYDPDTKTYSAMSYDHQNGTTLSNGSSPIFEVGDYIHVDDPNPEYANHSEYFIGYTDDNSVLTLCYGLYYLHTNTPWDQQPVPVQVTTQNLDLSTLPCFLIGTRIETARGLIAVEDLVEGDMLATLSGAFKPLRWIGRRTVSARLIAANPGKSLPIRIFPGALGQNLPRRDLWLSPDHCLHHEGALIKAQTLINGRNIQQDHPGREIVYYHLLLDRHEVIFAEGAETESYRPAANVFGFQNSETFPRDLSRSQPKSARCYPVISQGPQVDALRAATAAHAEEGIRAA